MNTVSYFPLAVATSTTGTTQVYVGASDVLQLFVPRISTSFGSAVVAFRVMGSYASSVSALTSYYYSYASMTANECVVTATTGGIYEIPNAGGSPFIRIQYDVAATQATSIYLVAPKTTF